MSIDNSFMIKKIETFKSVTVLFSAVTHLPFIVCDEETFDDQIYMFSSNEMANEFARPFLLDKNPLQAVQLPQTSLKNFLLSLYGLGVNAVMVQDEGAPVRMALEQLIDPPEVDKIRNKQMPQYNPQLQLTMLYFAQEVARPITHTNEDNKRLQALEEEMAHNLLPAPLILAFDTTDVKIDPKNPADRAIAKAKIQLYKANDGKTYRPVYTEFMEFQRFVRQGSRNELALTTLKDVHHFLPQEASGIVINPAGASLLLTRERLQKFIEIYSDRF